MGCRVGGLTVLLALDRRWMRRCRAIPKEAYPRHSPLAVDQAKCGFTAPLFPCHLFPETSPRANSDLSTTVTGLRPGILGVNGRIWMRCPAGKSSLL